MFSIFPAPRLDWKAENMRFMLCALPLVGAAIGVFLVLWNLLCGILSAGTGLYAAGMALLPIVLSGGIHIDGFCDTVDALSSHAAPERKREILKDPHVGTFAVLAAGAYLLLACACWTELPRSREAALTAGGFCVLSRALGALASTVLPASGRGGLLATFSGAADRRAAAILVLWLLACGAWLAALSPSRAAVSLVLAGAWFLYVKKMSRREFGGMSGDLAGFLIAGSELTLLLGQALIVPFLEMYCVKDGFTTQIHIG